MRGKPYHIRIERRSLGCNFNNSEEAVITVWAPFADKVAIEKNGKKRIDLKKKEFGYWDLTTSEIQPGDRYLFVLNEDRKFPDPASLLQPDGVHEASEAVDLRNFSWSDNGWKGMDPAQMLIYELHVGTFTPEATFQGVIKKLDYLLDLGVNAVEIMPVSQFPGDRNWGYDGVYVYAVQNSYGGYKGLRELVNECHKKGIAVILDVVYNHNGPEGNYLQEFGPYFTDKYRIPWGNAVNYDDAWCDGVRQYYIENALMWFRDFKIDALRLDAIHAIKDLSAYHFLAELSSKVKELEKTTGRQHVLIGECDLNDTKYIDPLDKRGFGLNAQWCDEFHHALHAFSTGERLEYYADFGKIEHVIKTIQDAYIYDGIYSPHRKKVFGTPVEDRSGNQFVVFIQNHDQTGNRLLGERLNTLIDFEMYKLLAGTMFFSPYIPLLFMGEEYGETNPFLYFNSHSDPELIRQIRSGRKNEFKEFFSQGEPADPQDEDTFQRSKLSWDFTGEKHRRSLLNYYREWIRLKKEHPVLSRHDRKNVSVKRIGDFNLLAVKRQRDALKLTAILNFEKDTMTLKSHDLEMREGKMIINSASRKWGGQISPDSMNIDASGNLMVNPNTILVIESTI